MCSRCRAILAGKVAQALRVALTPAAAQTLAARPTADLAASDAFLGGERQFQARDAPANLRRAIAAYDEAVDVTPRSPLACGAFKGRRTHRSLRIRSPLRRYAIRLTWRPHARCAAPNLPDAHAARSVYYESSATAAARWRKLMPVSRSRRTTLLCCGPPQAPMKVSDGGSRRWSACSRRGGWTRATRRLCARSMRHTLAPSLPRSHGGLRRGALGRAGQPHQHRSWA